jgi:rubrerythrin
MDETVFICEECGEKFTLEESGTIYEDGLPVTACPNPACRSASIEEAARCRVCGEICYQWKLKSGGVCPDCFADAKSAWRSWVNDFTPWMREALEVEYGNLDVTED